MKTSQHLSGKTLLNFIIENCDVHSPLTSQVPLLLFCPDLSPGTCAQLEHITQAPLLPGFQLSLAKRRPGDQRAGRAREVGSLFPLPLISWAMVQARTPFSYLEPQSLTDCFFPMNIAHAIFQ